MANGTSRTAEFSGGFEPVKAPSFAPPPANAFRPKSVLDTFMPSGNGMGEAERGRLLYTGGLLPGLNGRSQATADKRVPLDLSVR